MRGGGGYDMTLVGMDRLNVSDSPLGMKRLDGRSYDAIHGKHRA